MCIQINFIKSHLILNVEIDLAEPNNNKKRQQHFLPFSAIFAKSCEF